MKNIFKTKIPYFILGVLVAITSTVFAYSYLAPDVGFTPTDTTWSVSNVKSALDSLRNEHKFEHLSNNFLNGSIYGIYNSSSLALYSGASRDGDYISLNSNNALYSIPNLSIPEGCYFIIVNGQNLTNAFSPDVVNASTYKAYVPKIVEKGNNYAYYYINAGETMSTGEFRIWNKSSNVIKIKTTMIFNVETCPY